MLEISSADRGRETPSSFVSTRVHSPVRRNEAEILLWVKNSL